ncbi:MAG TPA: DNA-processing protein DprA, partial [Pricia sp.]|nr:DNA-processing protein DprA [Pricia sp.]
MTKEELLAVLRLQSIPNIGDVSAKKLIERCGSPEAVFTDTRRQLLQIEGIGYYTLKNLYDAEHREAAETEYEYIQQNRIEYTYYKDAEHPAYLKHCVDSPILLFKRGNMNVADRKIISIVGTRNITSYGRAFCEKFIADIAPLDPIIVSGFAYGVDITAQRAAIKYGLQ